MGTTKPTSATEVLDAAFENLGYVSDAGMTNKNTMSSSDVKDWGGVTVMTTEEDYTDEYTFTLIEAKNVAVLKYVYGEENVTGDLENGITIKANSAPKEAAIFVIDYAYSDGTIKRDVIPHGKVKERGDTQYTSKDPVGFETTLGCAPDENGNTHYEYIQKGPAPYISE